MNCIELAVGAGAYRKLADHLCATVIDLSPPYVTTEAINV